MSENDGWPEESAPHEDQQHEIDAPDASTPVIPEWLSEWPGVILGVVAFVALIWIAYFGHRHGAVYGWVLLTVAVTVAAALWSWGYSRRRRADQVCRDLALCGRLEMAIVDRMDGAQFEKYCVDFLPHCGYADVVRVGHVKGRQAVDLTARMLDGRSVAVECKRLKDPVQPKVVNALLGAITVGCYQGYTGMVISSAPATSGARALAAKAGIIMIDRPVLQDLMGQAKTKLESGEEARGMHPVTALAASILGCAAIVLGVTFQVAGSPRSAAAVPFHYPVAITPAASVHSPAVPAPTSVVQQYFAAISRHDWLQVWQLGGKNLGPGRYTSYAGMVSGFRLCQRDVLTVLHASGPSVTGRFLAYEITGAVQTNNFSLTVEGGTITAGSQALLSTSGTHN